ncbi:MAG: twin-arginine translocation signal domain-containing protein, partial [Bryobacteraceae bacterium]
MLAARPSHGNEIIWSPTGFEPGGAQEETKVDRRKFIKAAAAGTAAFAGSVTGANAQKYSIPIIDTHVHLYDPTRPQGVPWPSPQQASIYRPFLPADYRRIAEPFGVVGM